MIKNVFKKSLVIGIIILFLGTSVIPFVSSRKTLETSAFVAIETTNDCDWIVDDEGDGDFTSIQDAVDAANENDVICVYSGKYDESVYVNKTLKILGNDSEYPPNGDDKSKPLTDCIEIFDCSNVILSNFSVYLTVPSGIGLKNAYDCIIDSCNTTSLYMVNCHDIVVKNCNVSSSVIPRGISLSYCNAITILDSICEASSALEPTSGIYLEYSDNNYLISNNCSGKPSPWTAPDVSIRLISSDSNTIKDNTCWNSDIGIKVDVSSDNTIIDNTIRVGETSDIAIELESSNNNDIINNVIEGSGNIGINLSNSNGNLIDKHEISKFEIGIRLYRSGKEKKNVITWNTLNDNKKYGMKLENTEGNEIRHNTFSFNGEYGISVDNSIYDDIQRNNICYNKMNELIATNSIGYYPACWWGVKIGCYTKIIEIESSISIYPWVTDGEGPPWKARTFPALYLHRIHELFPILQRLLLQRY